MSRFILILLACSASLLIAPPAQPATRDVFDRDNLVAWCIVPFDAGKRGPAERAAMLEKIGIKKFVYDYRAEHIPQWDDELDALKKHRIELLGWWFPTSLNDEAKKTLELFKRHGVKPQLWVTGNGGPIAVHDAADRQARIEAEVARLKPICLAGGEVGCTVALYNHGNWFGEPENQVAIVEALHAQGVKNVGIVYNLHHGHAHLDRLAQVIPRLLPHLLCFNLNGMDRDGEANGRKILPLGVGSEDARVLRVVRDSGYRGPIGILNHTDEDAEARLLDNLDGLDWLRQQLDGAPVGERPALRTRVPLGHDAAAAEPAQAARAPAYLVEPRAAFQAPPLWVELRATLHAKDSYNILVASSTKASPAHWEIFTMPSNGWLTLYAPGASPDHVRTSVDAADGKPHEIAVEYLTDKVRLYVDGQLAADQAVTRKPANAAPESLAIGRLVEGGLACQGTLDFVHISQGGAARTPRQANAQPSIPKSDGATLGLWKFDGAEGDVKDLSPHKLDAKRQQASVAPSGTIVPGPGSHLKALDARLRTTLVDRSARDVYMGVKVDRDGRLFVGGRERLFLFLPQGQGFGLRQELLQFPPDSIIIGLEFKGDDLYVLTDNALYLVPGGRVRTTDLKPQRILWGLPLDLHVSFHCLAWGPEGKLYLTHGDPLLGFGDWNRPDHWGHWTLYSGAENKPVPYTGQGAVLRVDPDGANVEVIARGLRGPVGLTFDEAGHLFTNDNDHESRAAQYAPMRLLHVVPGVDFSWPRGWMASKSPERFDLIEPLSADLGRGVPCDMAFAPSRYPIDSIAGRVLLARWDRGTIAAYRPRPRGASFSAEEEVILQGDENARPVGVTLAPDGRLFVTVLYQAGNQAAPDCFSDVVVVDRPDGGSLAIPPASLADQPKALAAPVIDDALAAARSDDDYLRQLGAARLAREKNASELQALVSSDDEPTRLAGVLAVGVKLTVPGVHDVPSTEVPLTAPKDSAFYKVKQAFYGTTETVDLSTLGRLGSYTIALRWAAVKPTAEQRALFDSLVQALDDRSTRVRLQAAYYLDLLNDPRTVPLIEATRRDVLMERLAAGPTLTIDRAWRCGPFDDAGPGRLEPAHPPESGVIDLTASYMGRDWREAKLNESASHSATPNSTYYSVRIESETRQPGVVRLVGAGTAALWINAARVTAAKPRVDSSDSSGQSALFLIDLQPGGNDLLVRWQPAPDAAAPTITLQAASKTAARLADKLDSSLLAERLRDAVQGGADPAALKAFEGRDWSQAAKSGDAAQGRRLFAALGCVKCHAISPQQEIVGAPSLVDARQRFTVPHLVESILVPSRQVAEPFRVQVFETNDGRTISGLVVSESSEAIQLLLPDASRKTLERADVAERTTSNLSVMPTGLVKTPEELEHLLAYLLSEKPSPP